MFERFSEQAREAVVHAQEEARALRHGYIGTEHLLLGVVRQTGVASRALLRLGIDIQAVRSDVIREVGMGPTAGHDPDAEALRAIGIDVDEVRRQVEEAFGPGALDQPVRGRRRRRRCDPIPGPLGGRVPFTPRAKKALELSLREAMRLGDPSIGTEHVLLGIVREERGLGAHILAARGAQPWHVQDAIRRELGTGDDPIAGSG
jgi:ATP-dependent Clp protease ATP-binding subunit ClpA